MAFDQPLAADRVDDFNLFSAFVRAPLWILGGVLGRQNEEDDTYPSRRLDDDNCDENNPPAVNGKSPCHKRVVSDYDLSSTSQSTNDCEGPLTTVSIDSNDSRHPPGLKRTKNLSWSDESGKSLVEYNDEVSYFIVFLEKRGNLRLQVAEDTFLQNRFSWPIFHEIEPSLGQSIV
eukprot:CAMPEP_0176010960 /NCGR_PEP_ID=MMETSP0120_2-20121206/5040_1 /TAXON_ID=160619 /ORGANISM="Kryptoperidinium foliaceum, Strain CCMP 1326" /LENGTH=174 /DNA_ID=CAMNT_0017343813 /DNA_START=89 /DNA_END=613 /DNA_ORIENTATION=-